MAHKESPPQVEVEAVLQAFQCCMLLRAARRLGSALGPGCAEHLPSAAPHIQGAEQSSPGL